jgi:integrase
MEDFCKCFDEWLRWHRGTWRPQTHYNTTSFYLGLVGPHFKGQRLDRITPLDIITFLDSRPIGPTTRKEYVKILRRFWRWAQTTGHTKKNPVTEVPVNRAASSRRLIPLSVEEATRALSAATEAHPQGRAVLATLLLTGLRKRNLLRLSPSHISGELLHLPGTEMKNGQGRRPAMPPCRHGSRLTARA